MPNDMEHRQLRSRRGSDGHVYKACHEAVVQHIDHESTESTDSPAISNSVYRERRAHSVMSLPLHAVAIRFTAAAADGNLRAWQLLRTEDRRQTSK